MKITSIDFLVQLERLGASFPWERVELQAERDPGGQVSFVAYLPSDPSQCLEYVFGRGNSPRDAVDDAIKQAAEDGPREPESLRRKKIAELEEAIRKLKAAKLPALPPFKPNLELTMGELTVSDPVVEV